MQNRLLFKARKASISTAKLLHTFFALWLASVSFSIIGYGQLSTADLTSEQRYNLEQAKLYNEEAKRLYKERRIDEAIPFAQKAIEFNQAALGTANPTTAQLIENLATLFNSKGEFVKAEDYRLQALALREKALGKEHPIVGDALLNLGLFYKERGAFGKAETMYLKATNYYLWRWALWLVQAQIYSSRGRRSMRRKIHLLVQPSPLNRRKRSKRASMR